MSDADIIQTLIDTAPPRIGVHCRTIVLEPREYLLNKPVQINKQVRIIGDNTKIKLQPGSGTAFKVTGFGGESRIEALVFEGSDTTTFWPSNSEIGLDLQGGRVIVDQCTFVYLDVGVLLNSSVRGEMNTDGCVVQSCQFSACVTGLWANSSNDSQTGTISDNHFSDCRRGVIEESVGNLYQSNYFIDCPHPDDPKAAEGFRIRANSFFSTFVSVWLETGITAQIDGATVIGGDLPPFASGDCERVGSGWSALRFRTRGKNGEVPEAQPVEVLHLGGPWNFHNPDHPTPVLGYLFREQPPGIPDATSYRFVFFDTTTGNWKVG